MKKYKSSSFIWWVEEKLEEKFGGWLAHTQPLNRAVPRGQIREAKGIQQTQETGTGMKREEKLQIQSQNGTEMVSGAKLGSQRETVSFTPHQACGWLGWVSSPVHRKTVIPMP